METVPRNKANRKRNYSRGLSMYAKPLGTSGNYHPGSLALKEKIKFKPAREPVLRPSTLLERMYFASYTRNVQIEDG
jgi:hypothetical protein